MIRIPAAVSMACLPLLALAQGATAPSDPKREGEKLYMEIHHFAASGVPGAPGWHLAPLSMAWEGKTPGEICRSVLDRRTNGNKSLAEIVKHLTEDELVAWAWDPGRDVTGNDRQPVPIAKPEFNRIVHAWAKAGAVCPK